VTAAALRNHLRHILVLSVRPCKTLTGQSGPPGAHQVQHQRRGVPSLHWQHPAPNMRGWYATPQRSARPRAVPYVVACWIAGDDGNYGSSAVCDTECLQALSKRIHFGKFIAEV
jgi:hypothetical protein